MLLLLFGSLDRFVGLFVLSEGIDSVAGDKVSEYEIYPFGIVLLSYLLVCLPKLLSHSDIFTAIMGVRIARGVGRLGYPCALSRCNSGGGDCDCESVGGGPALYSQVETPFQS